MSLTFNGLPQTIVPSPTTTDATGHFTCTFVVPALPDATYTVTATDSASHSASKDYEIDSAPPPVPESPIGIIAPFAAIALAFGVFATVKRSKGPTKPIFHF